MNTNELGLILHKLFSRTMDENFCENENVRSKEVPDEISDFCKETGFDDASFIVRYGNKEFCVNIVQSI